MMKVFISGPVYRAKKNKEDFFFGVLVEPLPGQKAFVNLIVSERNCPAEVRRLLNRMVDGDLSPFVIAAEAAPLLKQNGNSTVLYTLPSGQPLFKVLSLSQISVVWDSAGCIDPQHEEDVFGDVAAVTEDYVI